MRDTVASFGLTSVGGFLDEDLGHRYVALGIVAHELYVDWPAIGVCGFYQFQYAPNPVEQPLRDLGLGPLLVDLDPRGGHTGCFDPDVEYYVGDLPVLMRNRPFDALFYFDVSPAMHPLAWPPCSP